ncbi:hypothetical protein Tco_1005562 [Tanacetum coccineum]|uniref:Uncharacterized protein n=1 Tax=Tanacetum coccineum TaxID=301880 RepID=A0ABQ5FGB3_9ASTR
MVVETVMLVCIFELSILREDDSAASSPGEAKGLINSYVKVSVREEGSLTLEVPTVKNSSYKGPKSRSNSCCDGAVVSAEGETFRASFELESSLLWSRVLSSVLL